MRLEKDEILIHNEKIEKKHIEKFLQLSNRLADKGLNVDQIVQDLMKLQIAIPSWALGTGGTRFGRFPEGGEPRNLEEKIEDVGLLHALNRSSGAISLHIPWDIPENYEDVIALASSFNLKFDAVNSNTFQDQKNQKYSYKFGSLCHTDPAIRNMAIDHNKQIVHINTPYDDVIIKLNSKLNSTYISYGAMGNRKLELQSQQDSNATELEEAVAVKRAVSKSSGMYKNSSWDLIDASEEDEFDVSAIKKEALPKALRDKSKAELTSFIGKKKSERKRIQKEIQELNAKREIYISKHAQQEKGELENAMLNAIKRQAARKSFKWE